ncbi:MAG: PAS domain S-box protein, partial [Methanomicrobiales archaeon]|nr:PAS domain S-box protein [Methanomicrobiales archaeon]
MMEQTSDEVMSFEVLRVLLDQNPVAMAQFDVNFNFLYVNQAFCDLSGMSFEKLTHSRIADLKILKLEGEGSKAAI